MSERTSSRERQTAETQIKLQQNHDGGQSRAVAG